MKEIRGTYNTSRQIKFETSVLKSYLYDYSCGYVVAKETITVPSTGAAPSSNNKNKEVVFKSYAPFIDYISEISNTQIDNAKDIDVVMSINNLIEYSAMFMTIL